MVMTKTSGLLALGLLASVTFAACEKPAPDPLLGEMQSLETAGFKPEGFVSMDATSLKAGSCQSGSIAKLSALLCEYPSADAAAAGKEGAEAWIGSAVTGVVLTRDQYLLALSDSSSVDPNGKTIAAISDVFQKVPSQSVEGQKVDASAAVEAGK